MNRPSQPGRILIVDDCPMNLDILRELLGHEYELEAAESGEECLQKVVEFAPDLILLDIMMPGIDGYETCQRIKQGPMGRFIQIIMVSGKASMPERLHGFEAGADDYVTKPFDHEELLARIKTQFRLRETQLELWEANATIQQFNAELEQIVHDRTAEVTATRDVAIFALAKLAESRDPETGEHLERMRNYSRILADALRQRGPYAAQIDSRFVDDIFRSSPLHDIGKVGIPDQILLKPGRLTREEFEIMKQHAVIGGTALEKTVSQGPCGGFLDMAAQIAWHHHERYNGSGYPHGLAGKDIPLPARIVAVADVFDALTSRRVYKDAYSPEKAREMIESESGEHFDPVVVDAFIDHWEDFLAVYHSSHDDDTQPAVAELLAQVRS